MKSIIGSNPVAFQPFSAYFIEKMEIDFSTRTQIIRECTQGLALWMGVNVPDYGTDSVMADWIMANGLKSKLALSRCTYIQLFNIILSNLKLSDPPTEEENAYLQRVEDFIGKALGDAGVESRDAAYLCLHMLKSFGEDRWEKLHGRMKAARQKRYAAVIEAEKAEG